MSAIAAERIDDGLYEWANVVDGDVCDWITIEKCARAIVHMTGHGSVDILGSLYQVGDGERVMRLSAAQPIAALSFMPWRVRPVVHDGEATIRLYIPRGQ